MMDPLFQEKLMRSLRDSVSYFNDGMSPTEAVTKSASACNFNAEQAGRLAETFNTARTIYHFNKNADSDNKGATFELADPSQVVLNLFGPKKTEKAAELHDYSDYDRIPIDHTLTDIDISFSKKANEMQDLNMTNQGYRIRKVLATYRTMAEDAHSKAAMADLTADQILEKLAGEIRRGELSGSPDKLYRLSAAMFDTDTIPVFMKLANHLPAHLPVKYDAQRPAVIEDRDIKDWKDIIKRAQDLMEQSAEMIAIGQGLEKDATELDKQFTQLFMYGVPQKDEGSIGNFFTVAAKTAKWQPGQNPGKSPIIYQPGSNPTHITNIEGGGGAGSGSGGGGGGGPPSKSKGEFSIPNPLEQVSFIADAPAKLFDTAMGGLTEPINKGIEQLIEGDVPKTNKLISAKLQNLQRTVLLEDLISNDPVLSDADPKQVAQAYQAVMQLAPNVSLNKEVVRSILRQVVHAAALDPFTAGGFLNLEKTIKEVTGTMPRDK